MFLSRTKKVTKLKLSELANQNLGGVGYWGVKLIARIAYINQKVIILIIFRSILKYHFFIKNI
jgi:hypothetical protein